MERKDCGRIGWSDAFPEKGKRRNSDWVEFTTRKIKKFGKRNQEKKLHKTIKLDAEKPIGPKSKRGDSSVWHPDSAQITEPSDGSEEMPSKT